MLLSKRALVWVLQGLQQSSRSSSESILWLTGLCSPSSSIMCLTLVDCNDSTADSRIRNPSCWLVYHVDFTRIKPTTLGSIIETKWAGRALDISPSCCCLQQRTCIGYGYPWYGSVVLFTVIFKIVLENIEPTRPIAILLAERVHQSMRLGKRP